MFTIDICLLTILTILYRGGGVDGMVIAHLMQHTYYTLY